ncbi:hypothetical protein MRB53_037179 [Persea americana]|nr:hypothetical protein MRB53_037179 [Persea americana]
MRTSRQTGRATILTHQLEQRMWLKVHRNSFRTLFSDNLEPGGHAHAGSCMPQAASTHALGGLVSGFASAALLQPIDTLKTRVQQAAHLSVSDTVRAIISQPNPLRTLWRGALPSTIRTSVGSALYFTTLNAIRSRLAGVQAVIADGGGRSSIAEASSSALPKLSPLSNLMAGAVARASVGFVMMPITVIKVRYESDLYAEYRTLLGAARQIWSTEGLRGFFAGFGATALRDAPYAGLYVLFYETGKGWGGQLVRRWRGDNELQETGDLIGTVAGLPVPQAFRATTSASINFASSLFAASVATAITNPPDAVKTRLQLRPQKYKNTVQATKLMLKEEGVRSLFDGLGLRMARKAMSSALAWTLYEEVLRRADKKWTNT